MRSKISVIFLAIIFALTFASGIFAANKYEYKIVPLGSLTSLQKGKDKESHAKQIEALLNEYGKDGWDISEIFAVRTTFDPNVFFVIMKREID